MAVALALSGCDGDSAEPGQEVDPSPSPTGADPTGADTPGERPTDAEPDEDRTGDATSEDGRTEDDSTQDDSEDDGTQDDTTEDEGTGAGTGTSDDDDTGHPDEDPDAPGLADGPEWVDPGDQVEVAQGPDSIDVGQEITGVRIAAHDDFDRVVLDLTGDEVVLGWFGLYEDAPYEAGSGRPIDFAGNAVLSVPVEGIDWTNPHPERTDGSDLGGPGGTKNVVEVVFGILFEGQQQVFVSVVDRTPYRIFPLNDPARIVIDVQHS